MPTLILVDCGLSMGRLVGKREDKARSATQGGDIPEITLDDDTEIRHLAIQAGRDILPKNTHNSYCQELKLLEKTLF